AKKFSQSRRSCCMLRVPQRHLIEGRCLARLCRLAGRGAIGNGSSSARSARARPPDRRRDGEGGQAVIEDRRNTTPQRTEGGLIVLPAASVAGTLATEAQRLSGIGVDIPNRRTLVHLRHMAACRGPPDTIRWSRGGLIVLPGGPCRWRGNALSPATIGMGIAHKPSSRCVYSRAPAAHRNRSMSAW